MNVIVSGASKGIGKAIAEGFVAEGHTVILCARNKLTLEQTAEEIKAKYRDATLFIFPADLSIQEEVTAFAQFCLQKGTPHVLVNNAGTYLPGNVLDEPDGSLEAMMAINLYSAYHLSRILIPAMIENKQGHVFNICSVAALQAYEGGGGYSISKFALHGLSENMRHELKYLGVKVTAVFPGAVLTDSWGNYDNSERRIMEANDIAHMIVAATKLSSQAVVESITIRPQLGDL